MAIRVKSKWHKTENERSPQQAASVVASLIWRIGEERTTHMQQDKFEVSSMEQGFAMLREYLAFFIQHTDRFLYPRVDDEYRAAMVNAMAKRIAEIWEDNLNQYLGQREEGYQQRFIEFLNERLSDYAGFDYQDGEPAYPCRRYLGASILEYMPKRDRSWTIDQVVEIEIPSALLLLKKGLDGLFAEGSGTL
jgi:hypothetical protein